MVKRRRVGNLIPISSTSANLRHSFATRHHARHAIHAVKSPPFNPLPNPHILLQNPRLLDTTGFGGSPSDPLQLRYAPLFSKKLEGSVVKCVIR